MPVKTWDASSNLIFDSDSITNGVCLGVFDIASGSTFSRTFSLLSGATIRVLSIYGTTPAYDTSDPAATITVTGSPPTVAASAVGYDRTILLWATGTVAIVPGAGMQALNASGNVALTPEARGLNFIGKATYTGGGVASVGGGAADGYLGSKTISINSPAGARPIGVVRMDGGEYVRWPPIFFYAGSGVWQAEIQAVGSLPSYSTWPALATPEVYCFAVPATASTAPKLAIYDSDGTLSYDLMAGRILDTAGRVTVPAGATSDTSKSVSIPAVTIPGLYGYPAVSGEQGTRFAYVYRQLGGYWHLSGSTLSVHVEVTDWYTDAIVVDPSFTNRYWADSQAEIIDLAPY